MYKRISASFAFATLLVGGLMVAPIAEEVPDVTGVWRGITTAQSATGFSKVEAEFRFVEQEGALFRGIYHYRLPESGDVRMHDGENVVWEGEEKVMGVIDWDNRTIRLSDHGDDGHYEGRLINSDTMELIYFESGEFAVVGRGVYLRHEANAE